MIYEPKVATTSERNPLRGHGSEDTYQPNLQLALGTFSFTVCFAARGLISAFAPRFREEFHLSATQTAFLIAVPVLLGALLRIATGMLADRFGGRAVFALLMIVVAAPAYIVPTVPNYRMLLYVALFLGMAGTTGSVTVSGTEEEKYSNPCLPHSSCPTITYDQGIVTATVNGFTSTVSYGESSTSSSVAAGLASGFNVDSSPVTATSSGGVVSIASKVVGSEANYSLSASRTSYDGMGSFPVSASGSTLTGGTGGGPTTFGTPLVTLYTYNALNQLIGVVQGAETRTYSYDGLGRITQETTPEAGTWTISYTASGSLCSGDPSNICSITDAKRQTTTYTYDSANRVTSKSNSAGTISYYYDHGGAGAQAIGRLTEMTDPSGSETYAYDKDGRITSLQKVIGSNTYTTSY